MIKPQLGFQSRQVKQKWALPRLMIRFKLKTLKRKMKRKKKTNNQTKSKLFKYCLRWKIKRRRLRITLSSKRICLIDRGMWLTVLHLS